MASTPRSSASSDPETVMVNRPHMSSPSKWAVILELLADIDGDTDIAATDPHLFHFAALYRPGKRALSSKGTFAWHVSGVHMSRSSRRFIKWFLFAVAALSATIVAVVAIIGFVAMNELLNVIQRGNFFGPL